MLLAAASPSLSKFIDELLRLLGVNIDRLVDCEINHRETHTEPENLGLVGGGLGVGCCVAEKTLLFFDKSLLNAPSSSSSPCTPCRLSCYPGI